MDRVVDVLYRSSMYVVPQQDELVRRDTSPLEVAGDVLVGHVGREVVDDDDAVVAVILLQERFDVPGVPVVGGVLEGGSDNTGVDLLLVLRNIVLLLVVGLLLLEEGIQFRDIFVILANEKLVAKVIQKLIKCNLLPFIHPTSFTLISFGIQAYHILSSLYLPRQLLTTLSLNILCILLSEGNG